MAELPPYDLGEALEYIASLQALAAPAGGVSPVTMGEEQARELRLQPDLGPVAGPMVALLAESLRPPRILEIGTSVGSTARLLGRAAATYGGRLLTIENRPELVEIACANLREAGLESVVEVLCADAREAILDLEPPYGLILQDGHKDAYLPMLDRLVALLPADGLLVTDDVLFPVMKLSGRAGGWQEAIEVYNRALAARSDLRTVWLPVGDGIAISLKL